MSRRRPLRAGPRAAARQGRGHHRGLAGAGRGARRPLRLLRRASWGCAPAGSRTRRRASRTLTGAVDVTDPLRLEQFANAVIQRLGPIDLWVNNAGVLDPVGPQRDLDPAEVDRALAVNIGGVVNGTRVFTTLARMFPDRPRRARQRLVGRGHVDLRGLVDLRRHEGRRRPVHADHRRRGAWAALLRRLARSRRHRDAGADPGHEHEDSSRRSHGSRRRHDLGAWNSPDWVGDHLLGILAGTLAPERVVYRVPDEPRS